MRVCVRVRTFRRSRRASRNIRNFDVECNFHFQNEIIMKLKRRNEKVLCTRCSPFAARTVPMNTCAFMQLILPFHYDYLLFYHFKFQFQRRRMESPVHVSLMTCRMSTTNSAMHSAVFHFNGMIISLHFIICF